MKIRKAKKEDLKEVGKIFKLVYSEAPYNENWLEENVKKKVKKYFKTGIIFVAEEDKIVGAIIGHEAIWDKYNNCFIDEIFVLKEYRGRGFGKNLILKFEEYFKEKGAKYIILNANPKSQAFKMYFKLGYHKSKDFVCMEKKLK